MGRRRRGTCTPGWVTAQDRWERFVEEGCNRVVVRVPIAGLEGKNQGDLSLECKKVGKIRPKESDWRLDLLPIPLFHFQMPPIGFQH